MDSRKQNEELKDSVRCLQLCKNVNFIHKLVSSPYIRERRASRIYQPKFLGRLLGLKLGIILSQARDRSALNISARWPLKLPFGLGQVITGQLLLRNGIPSLPRMGLTPQNVIPKDSEIIKACEECDIQRIQEILMTKQAHPNDRTPNEHTVLRVGCPAAQVFSRQERD